MSVADGTRKLKVGVMLPQMDGMQGPGVRRWSEVADMARRAEDVGLDSVWVVDHLLYEMVGENEPRGCWEAWSFLSALAAVTSKVELGTLVLAMGWRNPALLAKMADTVEEISDGRLILGLGSGYHRLEYDAFGFPYSYKVSRFEEAIEIVSGLLKDGEIDFEGKYHRARECVLKPRGPRAKGPTIMIGTNSGSKRMQALSARFADMWNVFYDNTSNRVGGFNRVKAEFDEACREHGRDTSTLAASVTVLVADPSADPWWDRLPTSHFAEQEPLRPLGGDPEEMAAELHRYELAGVSHIQISLEPTNRSTIESLAPMLEALDKLSG